MAERHGQSGGNEPFRNFWCRRTRHQTEQDKRKPWPGRRTHGGGASRHGRGRKRANGSPSSSTAIVVPWLQNTPLP